MYSQVFSENSQIPNIRYLRSWTFSHCQQFWKCRERIALGHTVHCLRHGFKSNLPIGPFLSDMFVVWGIYQNKI